MAEIVPMEEWRQLTPEGLRDTVLVLGASDSGKTTLVRWLVARLTAAGGKVAWIDADLGQSALGVPTTMTLAWSAAAGDPLPAPAR